MLRTALLGLGLIASLAGCSNSPVPQASAPPADAVTAAAAAPTTTIVPISSEFASEIATVSSALGSCSVGQVPSDLTCTRPLTSMVSLTGDIERRIRERPDAGKYADLFTTIDRLSDASGAYADEKCFAGFLPEDAGGTTEHDQTCIAYSLTLRLGWQTVTTQIQTAET